MEKTQLEILLQQGKHDLTDVYARIIQYYDSNRNKERALIKEMLDVDVKKYSGTMSPSVMQLYTILDRLEAFEESRSLADEQLYAYVEYMP